MLTHCYSSNQKNFSVVQLVSMTSQGCKVREENTIKRKLLFLLFLNLIHKSKTERKKNQKLFIIFFLFFCFFLFASEYYCSYCIVQLIKMLRASLFSNKWVSYFILIAVSILCYLLTARSSSQIIHKYFLIGLCRKFFAYYICDNSNI